MKTHQVTLINMTKFTKQQIARQDFVDNQIFELINNLLPLSKQEDFYKNPEYY